MWPVVLMFGFIVWGAHEKMRKTVQPWARDQAGARVRHEHWQFKNVFVALAAATGLLALIPWFFTGIVAAVASLIMFVVSVVLMLTLRPYKTAVKVSLSDYRWMQVGLGASAAMSIALFGAILYTLP